MSQLKPYNARRWPFSGPTKADKHSHEYTSASGAHEIDGGMTNLGAKPTYLMGDADGEHCVAR